MNGRVRKGGRHGVLLDTQTWKCEAGWRRKGEEGRVILVCVAKGKIYINWLRTVK